ncbi:hypothetical protein HJC23_000828 [Cyclotella cryptica]|uniref:Uncharacterized protein n=1 Tax=Cyclotella cryptica TaxID=29204 RepID=A0ABD3Q590_9STRA|eukprot:CCRYP_008479-RA/>CCRYP_008479-RA protein AED:0.01 eAED:0.01 QI:339/1/1/1/1/1/3/532/1012
MADNFLWDKESFNPGSDVENPSVSIDNIASAIDNTNTSTANARSEGIPRSVPKALKLGLVIAVLSVAVVLGVALGRNGSSSDDGVSTLAASGGSIAQQSPVMESHEEMYAPGATGNTPTMQTAVEPKPDAVKSIATEYYTSAGPLQARVRMVAPSILNGYETCSDLESDITEALKLYMDEFIMNEAVVNEMYANCDPDNDNWYSDLYGIDYYYYENESHDEANYTCSPSRNNTACATDSIEVPWAVTWYVLDHAEGELFYNETEARVAYDNVNSSWAKRLYDPSKTAVDEYGVMEGSEWCQVETWAFNAQCNGEAPSSLARKKSTKNVTESFVKSTRSSIPRTPEKQTRNRSPSSRTNSRQGDSKSSSKAGDNYGQNSQNDSANEQDRVVSDGTYIYAAYGDILYAWATADSTKGVSKTYLTENFPENECDWNSTETCTTIIKPTIRALYLSDSHLTAIVSQSSWDNPIPVNYTQPIITDYGTKAYVVVYDISEVTLGSPLKELGHKQLTGDYFDGRSIGNKTVIATASYIDTYALTLDLSRYQPQYCGLDSASYKELAAETAMKHVESFAKQMVAELELVNDCSRIFQISMMRSSIEGSGLTGADILGRFVQVTMFDASRDFSGSSDIRLSVTGAFTAGYGYSIYLADDFLAMPTSVYKYNYTSGTDSSETFILGFNLPTNGSATPYCYGHIPGTLGNNYYMDKWDGHLRVAAYDYSIVDTVNWTMTYANKVHVFELPDIQNGPGKMSLVGETDLADKDGPISGVRFVEDKAYISVSSWWPGKSNPFFVVDLSDHKNPNAVGHLNTSEYFSYLQQIDINKLQYILGIGSETDDSWQTSVKLSLIDVSTPSSPKMVTSYKEAGSYTDAAYDVLAVRYLPESNKLIIPVTKSDYNGNVAANYTDGFAVYDISDESITPAFDVIHYTTESYCWYDAVIPARSFVIQSELTTIKGHVSIRTEMKSGSYISKLDLDIGFNYSFCDSWLSYPVYYDGNFTYDYGDEVVGATDNSTRM